MGTTIIMVTHDPELARRAHRNVQVVDGQISDFKPYEPHAAPRRHGRRDAVSAAPRRSLRCSPTTCDSRCASFKRNPGLTALMVFAIALGISVCMITLTSYRAAAHNPAGERSGILFAASIDSWDPDERVRRRRQVARAHHAHLPRRACAVRLRHPGPQGHHVQGRAASSAAPTRAWTRIHRDAHDHRGLLPDVRRAVPVWRPLGRQGRCGPGAGGGAQQGDQPEGVRRREQRRQDGALARPRVSRHRRARRLGAACRSTST